MSRKCRLQRACRDPLRTYRSLHATAIADLILVHSLEDGVFGGMVLPNRYFHQSLAADLTWTNIPGRPLKLISYLIIFLATMLAGGLVAYLLRRLLKAAMLGWADRLAGGAVGLAAAMLIAALLLLPLVAYSPIGGFRYAIACAGSRAGIIPSVRDSSSAAFNASRSLTTA